MHTVHFGNDTLTNLGPKFWKLAPDKKKLAPTLSVFKSWIKACTKVARVVLYTIEYGIEDLMGLEIGAEGTPQIWL